MTTLGLSLRRDHSFFFASAEAAVVATAMGAEAGRGGSAPAALSECGAGCWVRTRPRS